MDTKKSFPTRVLILLTAFCWLTTLWSNITNPGPPADTLERPTLDLQYDPRSELDIVISNYVEHPTEVGKTVALLMSIPQISSRDTRVFIYSKNYQADLEMIRQAVLPTFESPSIMLMQNVGGEGETFLAHILSHWETLGNHTLFVHPETQNPRELKSRIANYFTAETGMLPLGPSASTCACDSDTCTDPAWSDTSGVVRDVFLHANKRAACHPGERLLLASGGAFIASAARIRGVDRAVYAQLRTWIVDMASWVHREPFLAGRPDHISAPAFAPALDRLWAPLLQCADPDIARYCPSPLAAWRPGGSRRDCQCLDTADPTYVPTDEEADELAEEYDALAESRTWSHVWSKSARKLAKKPVQERYQ